MTGHTDQGVEVHANNNNAKDTDMIEGLDSPTTRTRSKLDSASRESRASDSGISNEFTCDSNPNTIRHNGIHNGTNGSRYSADNVSQLEDGDTMENENGICNGKFEANTIETQSSIELHITEDEGDGAVLPGTPRNSPLVVETGDNLAPLTPRESRQNSVSPRPSQDGRYSTLSSLTAPPPSMIDGASATGSGPSSAELSPFPPNTPLGYDVVSNILERLINEHKRRDRNWEPSGRYNMAAGQRRSIVQMEEDIGKVMTKKKKVKEDARRVLELFLESSLLADPQYKPSGHYKLAQTKRHQNSRRGMSSKRSEFMTSDSSTHSPPQPLTPNVVITIPPPAGLIHPSGRLSPIQSAAERSSDMSGLYSDRPSDLSGIYSPRQSGSGHRAADFVNHQRDSYYDALYEDSMPDGGEDGFYVDGCYDNITEDLPGHIGLEGDAPIATQESLEKSYDGESPISLIALGDTKETTFGSHDKIKHTDVEQTAEGVHIHTHTEFTRTLSSSTSLSSILDDGGHPGVDMKDRKKKTFFTKATERFRHAMHRLQRSDSKSETEQEKYSVKPRPRKLKKKKKVNIPIGVSQPRRKSPSQPPKDDAWKDIQTHRHHFEIRGNAHIEPGGNDGLNADIWREGEGSAFQNGVVSKGKASTLPTKTNSEQKQRDKAQARRDKELKELIEQAKKNRKADRTESSRSNESLFKRFGTMINKQAKSIDSPGAKGERKNSFSFNTILRRNKKKSSQEGEPRSPAPTTSTRSESAGAETTRSSESKHFSDEKLTSTSLSANQLVLPESQTRSRSAEELPSPRVDDSIGGRGAPPRLQPQHSRSRSAQDQTTSEGLYSLGPRIQPPQRRATVDTADGAAEKRMYVPRSSPVKPHNYRPSAPRRHTTQVARADVNHAIGSVNMISSAGVRRPQAVKGGQRRSEDGTPMSPASSGGSMPLIAAGVTHGPREGLNLPLHVDANVTRTQSLSTRHGGQRVIRTVTSVDEMVKLGPGRRSRRQNSEIETDSEIEKLISIPASQRTQHQKEQVYSYIAAKISRMVRDMERVDDSSAYNTPMDENTGFVIGSSAPSSADKSSSLGRNSSFLSAKTSSSSSPHPSDMPMPVASAAPTVMEDIPESEGAVAADYDPQTSEIKPTNVSELGALLRDRGDGIHAYNPNLSTMFGSLMMENLSSYEVFEQAVDSVSTSDTPYMQRIAAVFSLTLRGIRYVGKTGQVASQIKDNALTYIEDKFASYIIGNGGWDSMIEESSSEWDVD